MVEYAVIKIIVDDTYDVTLNKSGLLGYTVVGVEILELKSYATHIIDLEEFQELHIAGRVAHKLSYIIDNFRFEIALDKRFKHFYSIGDDRILSNDKRNNFYANGVFNTFGNRISFSKHKYIVFGSTHFNHLSIYFLYDYDSNNIRAMLLLELTDIFSLNSYCIDTETGESFVSHASDRAPELGKRSLDNYYSSIGQFDVIGGVYSLNSPLRDILLPSDCKYFVMDNRFCKDVKNIVLPIGCKGFYVFSSYTPSEFDGCTVHISKNNNIEDMELFKRTLKNIELVYY